LKSTRHFYFLPKRRKIKSNITLKYRINRSDLLSEWLNPP